MGTPRYPTNLSLFPGCLQVFACFVELSLTLFFIIALQYKIRVADSKTWWCLTPPPLGSLLIHIVMATLPRALYCGATLQLRMFWCTDTTAPWLVASFLTNSRYSIRVARRIVNDVSPPGTFKSFVSTTNWVHRYMGSFHVCQHSKHSSSWRTNAVYVDV